MIRILEQTDSRLVVEDHSGWPAWILAAFFLLALYFNYVVWSGQSDDYFGAFITLLLPSILSVMFLRQKKTIFDKVDRMIRIESKALLKPAAPVEMGMADVFSAHITRAAGASVMGGRMAPRIILRCRQKNEPITAFGNFQHRSAQSRETVRVINGFLADGMVA